MAGEIILKQMQLSILPDKGNYKDILYINKDFVSILDACDF